MASSKNIESAAVSSSLFNVNESLLVNVSSLILCATTYLYQFQIKDQKFNFVASLIQVIKCDRASKAKKTTALPHNGFMFLNAQPS